MSTSGQRTFGPLFEILNTPLYLLTYTECTSSNTSCLCIIIEIIVLLRISRSSFLAYFTDRNIDNTGNRRKWFYIVLSTLDVTVSNVEDFLLQRRSTDSHISSFHCIVAFSCQQLLFVCCCFTTELLCSSTTFEQLQLLKDYCLVTVNHYSNSISYFSLSIHLGMLPHHHTSTPTIWLLDLVDRPTYGVLQMIVLTYLLTGNCHVVLAHSWVTLSC